MAWVPAVYCAMVNAASPDLSSGTLATTLAPSRKFTEPVGTLTGDSTLAESSSGNPVSTGFGEEINEMVGVAFPTTTSTLALAGEYNALPPKAADTGWVPASRRGGMTMALLFAIGARTNAAEAEEESLNFTLPVGAGAVVTGLGVSVATNLIGSP
jgi:hypothetical protein